MFYDVRTKENVCFRDGIRPSLFEFLDGNWFWMQLKPFYGVLDKKLCSDKTYLSERTCPTK